VQPFGIRLPSEVKVIEAIGCARRQLWSPQTWKTLTAIPKSRVFSDYINITFQTSLEFRHPWQRDLSGTPMSSGL
jgi:hypothetical protein